MQIKRDIKIECNHQKPIILDVFYTSSNNPKPVIVFSHGFKSFKDWGPYNEAGRYFARNGFIFIKFGFSHNGTTPEHPCDFVDLEAFGNNNFTIELDDLGTVIDWIVNTKEIPAHEKNTKEIYLAGHSRGGGISILKASEDSRVNKLATWAAVNDFAKGWPEPLLKTWKEKGVWEVENKRTHQLMPLHYQIVENYFENKARLNIPEAVKKINIPWLILHGTDDETVPFNQAVEMKQWNPKAKLDLIPGGTHTFGGKHPFDGTLSFDLETVFRLTAEFFKK